MADALRSCRTAWLGLATFSFTANLLHLTRPLSRAEEDLR